MTEQEYLELYSEYVKLKYHTESPDPLDLLALEQQVQDHNKKLIERYPFLSPRNRWDDTISSSYDYTYTELDDMPKGWRIAFGIKMLEEIRAELIKNDFLDKYRIIQIKEKYGQLRWYDNGSTNEILNIITKYEQLSEITCIVCGAPATQISLGWISPYCDYCAAEFDNQKYKPIDSFYGIEN